MEVGVFWARGAQKSKVMAEGGTALGEPKSLQGSTVWRVEVSTSLTSNLGVHPNALTPCVGHVSWRSLWPGALVLGSGNTATALSLSRGRRRRLPVPGPPDSSQPSPPPAQPPLHSIPSAETPSGFCSRLDLTYLVSKGHLRPQTRLLLCPHKPQSANVKQPSPA